MTSDLTSKRIEIEINVCFLSLARSSETQGELRDSRNLKILIGVYAFLRSVQSRLRDTMTFHDILRAF